LTSIPYFKEIIIMSFKCDHCGHRDSEVNSAGEIQRTFSAHFGNSADISAKGVNYTVHLLSRKDLDRQLVKSNTATITLPDYQLTIPPGRGQLTTVEGVIRDTIRDLDMEQPVRRHIDPETAAKIDKMLTDLRELLGIDNNDDEMNADDPNQKPFKPTPVVVDDPSGNSFFQFKGTTSDSQWNMRPYNRTFEQNVTLGLVARPDDMPEQSASGQPLVDESHKLNKPEDFELRRNIGNTVTREDGTVVPDEIFSFPSTCSSCGHPLETLMQQVNIPYFQVSISLPSALSMLTYRTSSLWLRTVMPVDTEITRSSRVELFPKRVERSLSRSRTRRTCRGICSR
jgi:zinc finger protein